MKNFKVVKELILKGDQMEIKKWISTGNLDGEPKNTEGIMEQAAGMLDTACSWDIAGEIVFQGEDGKYYVGCTEFHISEANPDYIKDVLEMEKDILEDEDES